MIKLENLDIQLERQLGSQLGDQLRGQLRTNTGPQVEIQLRDELWVQLDYLFDGYLQND